MALSFEAVFSFTCERFVLSRLLLLQQFLPLVL